MVRAVIFDWYGTLAEWEHVSRSTYEAVLASFGYGADEEVVDAYHVRWDGVDHRAHSTDPAAYAAWTRGRLRGLVGDCGVPGAEVERVVDAIVEAESTGSMRPFPDAIPTLRTLRELGIAVGVCSNWGWDLETYLAATGVAPFLDAAVTSAKVGFRKPHPGIYALALSSIGVEAADAVFVGDSWGPDVVGPTTAGMSAVHVVRDPTRAPAPALLAGAQRVAALDELFSMDLFGGD